MRKYFTNEDFEFFQDTIDQREILSYEATSEIFKELDQLRFQLTFMIFRITPLAMRHMSFLLGISNKSIKLKTYLKNRPIVSRDKETIFSLLPDMIGEGSSLIEQAVQSWSVALDKTNDAEKRAEAWRRYSKSRSELSKVFLSTDIREDVLCRYIEELRSSWDDFKRQYSDENLSPAEKKKVKIRFMKMYMTSLSGFEKEYSKIIKGYNRFLELRKIIAEHNIKLVFSVVKKFLWAGSPLSGIDMVQEGQTGLMIAIDKYEVQSGNQFHTFAYWWIRQSISRALHTKAKLVKFPAEVKSSFRRINRIIDEFYGQHGRLPREDEIINNYEISDTELSLYFKSSKASNVTSIDKPVGRDDGSYHDFLADKREGQLPHEVLASAENKKRVLKMLDLLSYREREIIKLKFGLGDGYCYSSDECAIIFKVTPQRIRFIKERAMKKLKKLMKDFEP